MLATWAAALLCAAQHEPELRPACGWRQSRCNRRWRACTVRYSLRLDDQTRGTERCGRLFLKCGIFQAAEQNHALHPYSCPWTRKKIPQVLDAPRILTSSKADDWRYVRAEYSETRHRRSKLWTIRLGRFR